ncbi:intraflagellar transport complex B protein 46, partial [Kipferlia bialata]
VPSTTGQDLDDEEDFDVEIPSDILKLSKSKLQKQVKRYQAQSIQLETLLRPFLPAPIPAMGDVDPFVKIPRHGIC